MISASRVLHAGRMRTGTRPVRARNRRHAPSHHEISLWSAGRDVCRPCTEIVQKVLAGGGGQEDTKPAEEQHAKDDQPDEHPQPPPAFLWLRGRKGGHAPFGICLLYTS